MHVIKRVFRASVVAAAGIAGIGTMGLTAATPASAAPVFHTTLTISGIDGSGISGFVVDTHEQGQPNFENETWQLRGLQPGVAYLTVITLGCDTKDLPDGVLGYAVTGNSVGNASSALKIPRTSLIGYLTYESSLVGVPLLPPPPTIGAQLLVVPADGFSTAEAPLVNASAAVAAAVAASACQMVSTS